MPSRKGSPEIIDQIRKMSEQKILPIEISRRLGIARDTVKLLAFKNNIQLFTHQDLMKQRRQEAFDLYQKGLSVKEIRAYGYYFDTIHAALKERGVKPKNRAEAAIEYRSLSEAEIMDRLPKNDTYTYLGYKNQKYYFRDSLGNEFSKKADRIYQGSPYIEENRTRWTNQMVVDVVEALGQTILKWDGKIRDGHATIECKKCGHERSYINFNNFLSKKFDCPTCNNIGISKQEKDLNAFVQSLGFETQKYKFPRNGKKGRSKEIDIFVPEKHIGIEYCGTFWHAKKPKNYHYDKMVMCHESGIRLITIFSDEWNSRKNQIKGFIKSVLGKFTYKIYARECEVRQVNKATANDFFNKTHIQGRANIITAAYGLFYKDEMVACMSLGSHHRQLKNDKSKKIIVLNRFAIKADWHVPGGASRLFKHCKDWSKSSGYNEIISWSDNRWSIGNVYKNLEFSLSAHLKPDYSYTNGFKRFSKQSLRKTDEEKILGKTELELRTAQGYKRLYDCGKIRWSYKLV